MLCPLCRQRGGERVAAGAPFERWRCRHCHQEYLVYDGYPVHPDALAPMSEGRVRCPVCAALATSRVLEAPPMGTARVFRCRECSTLFPAMLQPAAPGDSGSAQPDDLGREEAGLFVPIHPQAMIETVTGVERMPNFLALSTRLREYIEQTGFTMARTEDKMDLDQQVRRFTFFVIPNEWLGEQEERIQAVQGTLSFGWHAGHAQFGGAPVELATVPVPMEISLGVVINPEKVTKSLPAYLRLIEGLSGLLDSLGLAETTSIEASLGVNPATQGATINRLSCAREFSLDLRSPAQWAGLIAEMMKQKALLAQVWALVSGDNSNAGE